MYAEIPKHEIENKSSLLEAGKTYTISRFKVKAAKSSYMPFPADNMIEFTCYTRIALAEKPVDTFPTYVQTVVPFIEIRQHVREHPDFIGEPSVKYSFPSIVSIYSYHVLFTQMLSVFSSKLTYHLQCGCQDVQMYP